MNIETAEKVRQLLEDKDNLVILRNNLYFKEKSIFGFCRELKGFDGIAQLGINTEHKHLEVASYIRFKNNNLIREKFLKFIISEINEIDKQIKEIQCI